MNNTALGAENKKEQTINFISEAHEKFYYEKLKEVRYYTKTEEQVNECRQYTVEYLFCCAYAPFFWQAIQIRYLEYATYNRELYALFGGAD